MRTKDFDYELPQELVAQYPAESRTASRMLLLDGVSGSFCDARFENLPQFLQAGDVLVFNDTRVIKARLYGEKDSGGRIEVLVERLLDERHVLAQINASHPPRSGSSLLLAQAIPVTVIERAGEFYKLRFDRAEPVLSLLEKYGATPLPPYIKRSSEKLDEERYQTVYAVKPGAVAAPTAGLHFDEGMLTKLKRCGIGLAYLTLHVGAGTFQPVRTENIADHKMHSEIFNVSQETVDAIHRAKTSGGRIVAVGTTSLRALEAAAAGGTLKAGSGETDIFITPGYRFRVVQRLLTNFHLPQSTLLMLISAFGGMENIRRAYRHAAASRYRFYSYGDAMLIDRRDL